MKNHLKNQTSPYLLQHADNPVDWYPWGEAAFQKAKDEDKPVFLSIGYSTCHWCHVMAHESFEDEVIAKYLNQNFVSIKVDKEERPDIDSIYMSVCQALTGSGGWPTTIFMTPEQKPFFAGTYFPKTAKWGHIGFLELIETIAEKWKNDRSKLTDSAEEITAFIKREHSKLLQNNRFANGAHDKMTDSVKLVEQAVQIFQRTFDEKHGGFGDAPKFPAAHNLLFLMNYYQRTENPKIMQIVDKTLLQMYRGGIFDHIGGGFCRYSTDEQFLVPHFEKMLYDNALLMMAYCKAYELTGNVLYQGIAEKTADYVRKEMTSSRGAFYCAQDADSEGVEGKYYLFEPKEIYRLLPRKDAEDFCRYFDITESGNFEGKNIPNLLKNTMITAEYNSFLPVIYQYRKNRYALHLDDKILTSWNGLMIAAMCYLYRVTKNEVYLGMAEQAQAFIENKLCKGDILFASWRDGIHSEQGFLDDYANDIFALLCLYEATFEKSYLEKAQIFCRKVIESFYDGEAGGYFLTQKDSSELILRPKETYDGAMPSGNSMMAYNLVRLYHITEDNFYKEKAEAQLAFLTAEAKRYPAGYAMFLSALFEYLEKPNQVTIVVKNRKDLNGVSCQLPLGTIVRILETPSEAYSLKNDQTTYYFCRGNVCLPPTNEFNVKLGL